MTASRIGHGEPGSGALGSEPRAFDDFGELVRAFLGADARAIQLDSGSFEGTLSVASVGPVRLAHVRSSRGGTVAGGRALGYRTFGFPVMSHAEAVWCGRTVSAGSITGYDRSDELEAIVPAGFESVLFAVEETLCERPGTAEESWLGHGKSVWEGSSVEVKNLRDELLGALRTVQANPQLAAHPGFVHEIAVEIPDRLAEMIGTRLASVAERAPSLRTRRLAEVLDVIESRARESLTVQELCDLTGVSLRSLRRAFRERFGVSPKRYLMARRLNDVRRELLAADPASHRVTDIASRWGFWHMGQFAADYRRFFGELPSATLHDRTVLRGQVAVEDTRFSDRTTT